MGSPPASRGKEKEALGRNVLREPKKNHKN
jgi:hypothetical protein